MRVARDSFLILAVVAACVPSASPSSLPSRSPVRPEASPSPSAAGSLVPRSSLTLADAATCAVTKPVQAPATISSALFGSASAFGSDALWVGGLGENGVILADREFVNPDGSIGWKFGWYRFASGMLSITGQRLDAAAPPLRASIPAGYGSSGFQASGVDFPTEGCWEVTGSLDSTSLTFVAFVLRTE